VPWEDLRYLFGEIMYGGHITDDWDRRLCQTYLQEYMKPEMVSKTDESDFRIKYHYCIFHPSPISEALYQMRCNVFEINFYYDNNAVFAGVIDIYSPHFFIYVRGVNFARKKSFFPFNLIFANLLLGPFRVG